LDEAVDDELVDIMAVIGKPCCLLASTAPPVLCVRISAKAQSFLDFIHLSAFFSCSSHQQSRFRFLIVCRLRGKEADTCNRKYVATYKAIFITSSKESNSVEQSVCKQITPIAK
jgi:hypothetical protein